MHPASRLAAAEDFLEKHATDLCKLLVIAGIPWIAMIVRSTFGYSGNADFRSFWAAGHLAWIDPTLSYDPTSLIGIQNATTEAWQPFVNPPPFLLLIAPLGLMSFPLAYVVWTAVTTSFYLPLAARLVGGWPALAFTAVLFSQSVGQNGLITAGLFIGAALTLRTRPFLAGACLGALILKPHLALLVPLALLCGRQWKAMAGAALAFAALAGIAWLVLGSQTYAAFLGQMPLQPARTLGVPTLLPKFQTPYAFFIVATGKTFAGAAQLLISIAVASIVGWYWSRPIDLLAKFAVLVAGTCIATPYLYTYDLVFQIIPIAWLVREGRRHDFVAGERAFIALAFVAPFYLFFASVAVGISLGSLLNVAIFLAVLHRLRRSAYRGIQTRSSETSRSTSSGLAM